MAKSDNLSSIQILTTGGTIASAHSEDGAVPSKSGSDLVDAVPELADYAAVSVENVMNELSFTLDFDALATLSGAVDEAAASDVDGVVITHGTDTMEESAYFLDLVSNIDIPIVFTGAQRRPDEVSPDGPSNLLCAVRVAASDAFEGADGVFIAFNDTVHAARDATKSHSTNVNAFSSPEGGPVATLQRKTIRLHRQPTSRSVSLPANRPTAQVEIVKSTTGIGGEQLQDALSRGAEGIVVEATGIGNVTAELGQAIQAAIQRDVPIVITSRCYAGSVEPVYGTTGGSQTLHEQGALFADAIPAHKARLKLALAIEASENVDQAKTAFKSGRSL